METIPSSVTEFKRRQRTFVLRGMLPVLLLVMLGSFLVASGMPNNNPAILAGNVLIFFAGVWYVITAKRYYRCPVCEKVVVSTKDDGTPSEISFGIDYKPEVCPYCAAPLG